MKTAVRSHVGRVRHINEDSAWIGLTANGLVAAVVADGMGGHKAGEVASGLAVESLTRSLSGWGEDIALEASAAKLRELIASANATVFETASSNEQYSNMGTTVVIALIDSSKVLIGHIGDSRIYRLRDGLLELLTEDHTLVNELVKSGQLSPEEAAIHPHRNWVTRALGTDREVKADVELVDWQAGDRLLLCSDGLTNLVEGDLIEQTMADPEAGLDRIAEQLIELALHAGGDDNITVALIDYDTKLDVAGGGKA
ncbi:Stp1/IreP family PP2C-type Ser/Thr phosphatase [Cohnella lubricantis]|uniref:Stp1/IreP family PP2C-type Ser/Thr phosphatase n=1 Tax=Cohnella lubricantis TaxID=2163172 RepID=A0A841TB00_9BACL|nr:Stp1/IreP family PP2C-type Ser/Thr phosphatase [Cohnella lubricantis]MBB6677205.1 Stp1/IreP family PP2C-type Ser/Thr phosphatase [Cohnella lubricantis]